MCLLITARAGVGHDLPDAWLEDFHSWNDDGYGFMFAHDSKLYIHKALGRKEQFIKDWRAFSGVDRAVHLRMRTHGYIDLENCHPYEVIPGKIALMHNGVLDTGNADDKSKSDTWHFIKDYLQPLLVRDPGLMLELAFQELLTEFIGHNNRFVLLDNNGNMVTINEDQGVMWEGMWLSNEYAWSSPNNRWSARNYLEYDDDHYNEDRTAFKNHLADDDYQKEEAATLAEDIDDAIKLLGAYDYKDAIHVDRSLYVTFVVQRGVDELFYAVDALLDEELDEREFCRLIKHGHLYAPDDDYVAA